MVFRVVPPAGRSEVPEVDRWLDQAVSRRLGALLAARLHELRASRGLQRRLAAKRALLRRL